MFCNIFMRQNEMGSINLKRVSYTSFRKQAYRELIVKSLVIFCIE